MLEKTGVPTETQIDSAFPNETRLNEGPVAVIECFQPIPCNPCAMACPRQAILPFADINDVPVMDNDKCNGCGLCVMKCPGLAIIVVDINWSETKALIKLPYEFRPLPQKGQILHALDREGHPIANAEVINVIVPANKTPVISIAVDKDLIKKVRNICIPEDNDSIVCRCSDITVADIQSFIAQGYTSVDELKRITRLGMGACQGRTCIPLVMRELSTALKKPISELTSGTHRPIVKSMKLGDVAAYGGKS
ncbi:MAG: (2Fe-2S)-binding protein [Defluviitaleaceae bacterium]|nr:(2Fe-2S)-binding protein [Defluviitaleaceae bacterium]